MKDVRQLVLIRTGYTSRIAKRIETCPELLDKFGAKSKIRLLAIKDDLWGKRNGFKYKVYSDGDDFGTTLRELTDIIYSNLELKQFENDGCIIFYVVGKDDVEPESVLTVFLDTFGSRSFYAYCEFCYKDYTSYRGVKRHVRIPVKEGISPLEIVNTSYEIPVHRFEIACESG